MLAQSREKEVREAASVSSEEPIASRPAVRGPGTRSRVSAHPPWAPPLNIHSLQLFSPLLRVELPPGVQKGRPCAPDSLLLGSRVSPPCQRLSALPVSPSLYFLSQSYHSENGQLLTLIIKVQSSVGPLPVVRCGLRPFRRLLGNDLPQACYRSRE